VPRITRDRPLFQPHRDGRHVADAAAQLAGTVHARQNRLDRRRIHRPAGKGAVQVDKMQPFAAGRLELRRLLCRIVAEDGGRRHLAAQEPHALAVLQVDGRIQDHHGPPVVAPPPWHGRRGKKSPPRRGIPTPRHT
jgi:hypothetical protein